MKKRFVFLALCAAMLAACAAARAELVAETGMYNDTCIYRYVAPNGQELFYTGTPGAMDWPPRLKDVNFDGVDDVVVITAMGASNCWEQLFIWNGERYEHAAWNWGNDTGLPNAEYDPETKLVSTFSNDGLAGALHHCAVYRWDGAKLLMIRCAVAEETEDGQRVHIRVREAEYNGSERTYRLVWETVADSDERATDEEYAALWRGLK